MPLDYWIALAMINAMPLTTETTMNVPAAKSQISVFVISSIGAFSHRPQP